MKKKLLLLVILFVSTISKAQDGPRAMVAEGILEGTFESGVKVFKGVPFAAPPIGDLRWRAPQPAKHWNGVRKAQKFGPDPMQENIYGDMIFCADSRSEDCLYLNIWTPSKTMDESLPVLIYFNGGALIAGSGSEPRYAGLSLAREGVISITANYREGIFGFFCCTELSKESTYKGSGNYGFMDQVAAIKWVKNNIKAFGGNPSRITVVGESAGSMSVSALMASPLCKGLFSQAIGSSGSIMGLHRLATLHEAEKNGDAKISSMGCKNLREMRALPADELLKKAAVKGLAQYNIDGYFFTEQPVETYRKGHQQQIPLMVGGTSTEIGSFNFNGMSPSIDNVKAFVAKRHGDKAERIVDLYGIHTDADLQSNKILDLASDLFIGLSTWHWWKLHQQTTSKPVYRYNYCWPRPAMILNDKINSLAGGGIDNKHNNPLASRAKGAVHSADIEYAMGTLSTNRVYDWQAEDYIVSKQFMKYYVNFIKTGNPNGLGLVDWSATNGKSVAPVMQIGLHCIEKADADLEKRYESLSKLFNY